MRPFRSIAIDALRGRELRWPRHWRPVWAFCMWIPAPFTGRWGCMWPDREGLRGPQQVLPRLPELQLSLTYGADGLQHMLLAGRT